MAGDVRGEETLRTYKEINERIENKEAVVMTADEFVEYAKDHGIETAAKEVDVMTTGTFGAMCSSGAFLNFGHSEPPIKMVRCWLNDVPTYKGLAAVDAYIGATAISETRGIEYGGGHVIEDLVDHREIELRGEGFVTDCYPRNYIETTITIDDLNQAVLVNPRNAYQRYVAATNGTDQVLYTYMGTLLPHFGNLTFSGSGQLSPLHKDSNFETIGIGTRIFLGGGIGYVIGEGTQHNPQNRFGTLMVRGDLKQMEAQYLRGATVYRYGATLYVGVGIPIPIVNMRVAKTASLSDEQIVTDVVDYGVPSRSRPTLRSVSYAELKSGEVELEGRTIPTSPVCSLRVAEDIAETLKRWIRKGSLLLSRPIELLPRKRVFKPMKARKKELLVKDVMTREVITARPTDSVRKAARLLVDHGVDHLPILDGRNRLTGIVTSWDIARGVSEGKTQLRNVMTSRVVVARASEAVDIVVHRLAKHNISGAPVVDDKKRLIGVITTDDLAKLLRGGR